MLIPPTPTREKLNSGWFDCWMQFKPKIQPAIDIEFYNLKMKKEITRIGYTDQPREKEDTVKRLIRAQS